MNKWHEKEINSLTKKLAELSEADQVSLLLDAIMTPREINDAALRLEIVRSISEGKSYSTIQQKLGVSSGLISKVSSKVGYGFRRGQPALNVDGNKKSTSTLKYKGAGSLRELI